MTAPQTPAGVRGRAPILIAVIVAVAAGIAAGRSDVPRATRPVEPVDAAQRSNLGALSTAWYCPGLPPSFRTRDQTITLSNVGEADADAAVAIRPGDGADPIVRRVSVPGHTVRSFDRGSLLVTPRAETSAPGAASTTTTTAPGSKPRGSLPPGAVTVEPFSPDVVVSAGIESATALDSAPSATSPSDDWYFAAGETVRGVKQWLMLDNPLSADARVNVSLRTDAGLQQLPELQGVDVPGRSRVVIRIDNYAVRQPHVAVEVHSVVGEVVAAQTLEYSSVSGTPGVASTLGALAPATRWWFTDNDTREGAAQWVAISDPGPLDAHFVVQAYIGADAIVNPVVGTVTSGGVGWVQVGGCARAATNCLHVPDDAGYELSVQTDGHVPIVAQSLSRFSARDTTVGATTSMGSNVPSRRWVIARTRVAAERATSVSLMNPDVRLSAHVDVEIVHDGIVERPEDLQGLTIAPNARVVLPEGIVGAARQHDAAIVITSDIPIFAASTIYAARGTDTFLTRPDPTVMMRLRPPALERPCSVAQRSGPPDLRR